MKVVTVELLNDRALALLKELEQLNILKVVSGRQEKIAKPKWAGRISKETGLEMLEELNKNRQEWNRN